MIGGAVLLAAGALGLVAVAVMHRGGSLPAGRGWLDRVWAAEARLVLELAVIAVGGFATGRWLAGGGLLGAIQGVLPW